MLKLKRDINKQDLKIVNLHFVKSDCSHPPPPLDHEQLHKQLHRVFM